MLYISGVDVLTAKEQAGHADIETTLNIYTHLDNTYKRKQIDKLNVFINSQKNSA
jgi:integrase